MKYKLNYWNPLTYAWLVFTVPVIFIAPLFTDCTVVELIYDWAGNFTVQGTNPRRYLVALRIVTPVKK